VAREPDDPSGLKSFDIPIPVSFAMVQTMLRAVTRATDPSVSRFEIHAERCPHLFAKIAGLLANRSITPHALHMRRSAKGMWMAIEADLAEDAAEQFAEKLRGFVAIEGVIHIPATPEGSPEAVDAEYVVTPAAKDPILVE
jgi:hypothetical protein